MPCPPASSWPIDGQFYRASKTAWPEGKQFQTHEESGRLPAADKCLRRSLSLFTSQADAEHQVRLFRGWKRRFVIYATLKPSDGQCLLTSGRLPSHASWWPAAELKEEERAARFNTGYEVNP